MSSKKSKYVREALAAFRRKTIVHPLYANAVEEMFVQLVDFDDPPIILFVGPAGAGKTRALKFDLPHRLLGDSPVPSAELSPYRPYVYTELPSVDQVGFRWKDYYERGLQKLNEPKITSVRRALPDELARAMKYLPEGSRTSGPALARLQLETAMIERRVRWWVMDNAAALVYVASSSSYMSQLNAVMSLANMTGTALIVSATYEILAICDVNGQLDRRTIDVELPRYNHERKRQESDDFCSAVLELLEFSPIPLQGDAENYLSMFYERSLGLFGCWKSWFDRTLCDAIHHQSHAITKAQLSRWAYPSGKLKAMRAEMIEGENLYEAYKENRAHLEDGGGNDRKTPSKKINNKPGKRNAHHDPVGETT